MSAAREERLLQYIFARPEHRTINFYVSYKEDSMLLIRTGPARATGAERTTHRMTAEEEQRLARLWRDHGDTQARERLITENMRLVVAIARQYQQFGVTLDELVAEGNLRLLHAVDGFDPDRGFRLSTYAAHWIRQGISRAFAAHSPRGQMNSRDRRDVCALEQAARIHYATHGREPSAADLAEALGWPPQRVSACRRMAARYVRPASLDQPSPIAEAPREEVRDDASEDQARAAGIVAVLLNDLTDRERTVIEMRFGMHGAEARGVDEIAASLDASRREARTLLRTALVKMIRRQSATARTQRHRDAAAVARDV